MFFIPDYKNYTGIFTKTAHNHKSFLSLQSLTGDFIIPNENYLWVILGCDNHVSNEALQVFEAAARDL